MPRKGLTVALTAFVLFFYVAIILYVFFAILHIDTLANFETAMVFEIIGFGLLAFFIMGNIILKPIKTGFFVPILVMTIIYTIILDVVNIALIATLSNVFFMLVNFIILFIYCLLSIPMYIMGRSQ